MHENKMLSAVLIGAAAVLSTSLVGWHYHGKHRHADAVTEADLVALEAAITRAQQAQAELDAKLAEHDKHLADAAAKAEPATIEKLQAEQAELIAGLCENIVDLAELEVLGFDDQNRRLADEDRDPAINAAASVLSEVLSKTLGAEDWFGLLAGEAQS